MDSTYSSLPRIPYAKFQSRDDLDEISSGNLFLTIDSRSAKKTSTEMRPVECIELKNSDEFDENDADFDIDNYPFAGKGISKGGSIHGAIFNLTTSIIGAGIMALPATMKVLGSVLGFALIITMGVISEISVELFVRFSVFAKAGSYGDAVEFALGRSARIVSEICIIVNNAGVLIVYLIIIGDVMSGSSNHRGVFDQLLGLGFWDERKLVMLIVVIVFLAPLCCLRTIDSLSFTSAASVALAVIFVVVVCSITLVKLISGEIEAPRMMPDIKSGIIDVLMVVPIMANAYICHFNVQPIYNELEERSPEKMNFIGRITTVICVIIYVLTAVSGYLLFGKNTEADVLTNFDADLGIRFGAELDYVVRIGYVLHLVLVFPVVHFSLRKTVDELLFVGRSPLLESRGRCLLLTMVLLGLVYFGSTMVPNIWVAFKFTGATTAVSLGFLFPPLMGLRLGQKGVVLSFWERLMCWVMVVLGVVVVFVGGVGNFVSIISESS